VYERTAGVAQSLYKAFVEAQRRTYDDLYVTAALKAMLPWLTRARRGHARADGRRLLAVRIRARTAKRSRPSCAITTSRGCRSGCCGRKSCSRRERWRRSRSSRARRPAAARGGCTLRRRLNTEAACGVPRLARLNRRVLTRLYPRLPDQVAPPLRVRAPPST
jgi:hypothetical protein